MANPVCVSDVLSSDDYRPTGVMVHFIVDSIGFLVAFNADELTAVHVTNFNYSGAT